MTEAENRNTRGFDFTTPNPIQAQAQAQFAANPPAGVPLTAASSRCSAATSTSTTTTRGIWDADTNNFQPRLGFTYSVEPTHGRPRRHRAVHRAVPDQRGAWSRQPGQPVGLFAQHPGAGHRGQRTDLPGQPDQPGAERPAPAAERIEPRAAHQPRGNIGRHGCGSFRPIGSIRNTGGSASASSGSSPATGSSSCRTSARRACSLPLVEQLNFVPQQFRTQSADPRQHRGDVPQPGGRQSVPGTDAGNAGQQRRDDRAPPAAAAVSAVRHTCSIETYRGTNTYHALLGASREALHATG